jgi:hypothetical protein
MFIERRIHAVYMRGLSAFMGLVGSNIIMNA